ncbi:carbamoyl-phosphate synthase (glutamine-hydrolyzing) large subunit [Candidatus Kaiserbacteria bacterium]|nr:carbamoyl-phosphate synthase (glutamine-hydrolyzing) large subunit [Candidatus Kaiserbacteria bacterium]
MRKPKKVLLLGSGGLKIGQAGEFDYSGSQAIKALKEEGIRVVLINPNIATIQTDQKLADTVYFLPLTEQFATQVIKKERPDGILLGFGGQTALNLGLSLEKSETLKRYGVRVLGTSVKTIRDTEDRDLFIKRLNQIGVMTARSKAVRTIADGKRAAALIGYPVMIRAGFALGGLGSGMVQSDAELTERLKEVFSASPQVLVEEYLGGWKEVEYEVVRDKADNCITVCNMENFDPMGIHTGDSIVVAPSQTLTNEEYHRLRQLSIETIRHLGIVGECNIQFALNPKPLGDAVDYRVIEVNARLSRSSALASKATGYPLAFVAAKLALGYTLPELKNSVTKKTTACFEPALDYLVLKMPRFDVSKFERASSAIGSEMKSVGEVMAIGRSFEEVLQKALRMLNVQANGVYNSYSRKALFEEIQYPTTNRTHAILAALRKGVSVEMMHRLSRIDRWFLDKMMNIATFEKQLSMSRLSLGREVLVRAKKLGFSDAHIAAIKKTTPERIRALRKKFGVLPCIKQIDTLAGEFPTQTNYLYLTYHGSEHDVVAGKNQAVVLGSGPYAIGSSVEFDWSGVQALRTLKSAGFETIMINSNPETVSTDYDTSDRLYFDELSLERVLDIIDFEKPKGVVVSTGGQIPNNLALPLQKSGVRILGTDPRNIDRAENRHAFSKLLDAIGVDQPEWAELTSLEKAAKTAERIGYPVLVRPSYVLSGAAMSVALDKESLIKYLKRATAISPDHPVVISKFIENAREIELDGVASRGSLLIYAITEHIENAGTHSGDATVVLPPQRTYLETIRRVKEVTKAIVRELKLSGPFNAQFIAKDNRLQVIECNVRASRSFPFVSKVTGHNFIDLAIKAMLGKTGGERYRTLELDYVAVKSPQFSYGRIKGADPRSFVEMASTGEVACFGDTYGEALLKSMLAAGFRLPKRNVLVSLGKEENKLKLLPSMLMLQEMKFKLFATEHTADFLAANGMPCEKVFKISTAREPNVLSLMETGALDLIINIPTRAFERENTDGYMIRRKAVDMNIPLITNRQLAEAFVAALAEQRGNGLKAKAWDEYRS